MVILGIESSAPSASAAIVKDGKLLSEMFLNVGLTHSVTLMSLIRQAVEGAGMSIDGIDAVAVSNGPGSFTGVRIGVSAAKGIAQPGEKICVPVSTLEAIAYPLSNSNSIVVSVMDARCQQVYCAVFDCHNSEMTRITQDDAISLDNLCEILKTFDKDIILIGDGTDIAYNYLSSKVPHLYKSSPIFKYQRASSVAMLAENKINNNEGVTSANDLVPSYLRLSQAERELKKKKENE